MFCGGGNRISHIHGVVTGPPNGPVFFACLRLSSVVVCNTAVGRVGRSGTRAIGWPTLQGGPVLLRSVRATPCSS